MPNLRRLWYGLFLLPLIFPLMVIFYTDYNTHSDEAQHLDAFQYYETHWLPPGPGQPDVLHDAYGESRLYSREIIYPLYGKLGRLLQPLISPEKRSYAELLTPRIHTVAFPAQFPISGPTGGIDLRYYQQRMDFLALRPQAPNYRFYRALNLLLLGGTLWLLWKIPFRQPPKAMFLSLLVLPSVWYIYSYANSDAFGLSLALLTTFYILHLHEHGGLTPRRATWLGILLGLLFASKLNYWISALYNLGLLAILEQKRWRQDAPRPALRRMLFLMLLIPLPYRVIFPALQGQTATTVRQAAETYARYGMKPSNPALPRLALAAKGYDCLDVLQMGWLGASFSHLYGSFNYDAVAPAPWVTYTAGLIFGLMTLGTLFTWKQTAARWRRVILWGGAITLLNLVLSFYRSWTYDYTPLGRYLFPSLIPLAWLTGNGLLSSPSSRLRRWHYHALTILALLHLVSYFTLQTQAR